MGLLNLAKKMLFGEDEKDDEIKQMKAELNDMKMQLKSEALDVDAFDSGDLDLDALDLDPDFQYEAEEKYNSLAEVADEMQFNTLSKTKIKKLLKNLDDIYEFDSLDFDDFGRDSRRVVMDIRNKIRNFRAKLEKMSKNDSLYLENGMSEREVKKEFIRISRIKEEDCQEEIEYSGELMIKSVSLVCEFLKHINKHKKVSFPIEKIPVQPSLFEKMNCIFQENDSNEMKLCVGYFGACEVVDNIQIRNVNHAISDEMLELQSKKTSEINVLEDYQSRCEKVLKYLDKIYDSYVEYNDLMEYMIINLENVVLNVKPKMLFNNNDDSIRAFLTGCKIIELIWQVLNVKPFYIINDSYYLNEMQIVDIMDSLELFLESVGE